MSYLKILELAATGEVVLSYDPYRPEYRLLGPEPICLDDADLSYCRDKGWVLSRVPCLRAGKRYLFNVEAAEQAIAARAAKGVADA